jgi:hypothetical protein
MNDVDAFDESIDSEENKKVSAEINNDKIASPPLFNPIQVKKEEH